MKPVLLEIIRKTNKGKGSEKWCPFHPREVL
jgi:hypothetical protein